MILLLASAKDLTIFSSMFQAISAAAKLPGLVHMCSCDTVVLLAAEVQDASKWAAVGE